MSDACGPVWVIAEEIKGRLLAVSLQLIGHARKLADELGSTVEAVLLGEGTEEHVQRSTGLCTVQLFAAEVAWHEFEPFGALGGLAARRRRDRDRSIGTDGDHLVRFGYLCLDNINLFLAYCCERFGLCLLNDRTLTVERYTVPYPGSLDSTYRLCAPYLFVRLSGHPCLRQGQENSVLVAVGSASCDGTVYG